MRATHVAYQPKTILNTHKRIDGGWFWTKYSANPYIGCQWGCEYCYLRDEHFNPHKQKDPLVAEFSDPFSEYIKAKENAPKLLRKALEKREPDLIRLGDYQPIETKFNLSKQMLEVCRDLKFPVFLLEKAPSVLKDIDLLKELSETSYLNVGWSIITTRDDDMRRSLEKFAPPVQSRFDAMKKLSENGILTGTVFMPILPFIYDDEVNIEAVIAKTKESGGQYVLDGGLSLYGYNKTHFLKSVEARDPILAKKMDELFSSPDLLSESTERTHKLVVKYCKQYGLNPYIPRPIEHFPSHLRLNKKIAGTLHLRAREIQLSRGDKYKEWAYRKAAWAVDDLAEDIRSIFNRNEKIEGVGSGILSQIRSHLESEVVSA